MHLCYIDESGTSSIPGNTSHFILAGISIPISQWRFVDTAITQVLRRYDLHDAEFHTAWMLRPYIEQSHIPYFVNLDRPARLSAVVKVRNAHLLSLQKSGQHKQYRQTKKNYLHTLPYVQLTLDERRSVVREMADCVSTWTFARLFAECIDKLHFDPVKTGRSIDEQSFEQVVSRFEQYLKNINSAYGEDPFGLLVHDNNETVARKHTQLMRDFHSRGTLWTQVKHIIETPFFVDSKLTRMVQIADLCSYALRRYTENAETELFRRVFARADRAGNLAVGVRHFTSFPCSCEICRAHRS